MEKYLVKIPELNVESGLIEFCEAWDINIDEILNELQKDGCCSFFGEEIELTGNIEGDLIDIIAEIVSSSHDIIDKINSIYGNEYLLIIKDIWSGEIEPRDCELCDGEGVDENENECTDCDGDGWFPSEEVEYTSFCIEGGDGATVENEIVFKGGQYENRALLSSTELKQFNQLRDTDEIDYYTNLKYQTFYFIKTKFINENGWTKGLESLKMRDWDSYNFS